MKLETAEDIDLALIRLTNLAEYQTRLEVAHLLSNCQEIESNLNAARQETIRQRIAISMALKELLPQPITLNPYPIQDAYLDWCEKNLDKLRQYPHEFVALHLDLGIIAHGKDEKEFHESLNKLDSNVRYGNFIFNTDAFI